MRILVTGANGLLGHKLTLLITQDPSVEAIATARGQLKYSLSNGLVEKLDVTDALQTERVIASLKPEVVIHTAAMTQVDQCETEKEKCWLNNVKAVGNLVQACEKTGAHLIHLSTDFIFDGTQGPLDETAKPNPISYYGQSKLAGEEIVQKSKLSWTILRTVLVYGVTPDMSRSNIVLWVKKSLEEGKSINVVNDQWRTPTLAEDLAMGCLLAAKKKAQGIYNISGEEMMTPYDIAVQTAHFFHLDSTLIKVTDSTQLRQPAARPPRTGFIVEKAKRELGYRPHTFEEGLAVIKGML